MDDEFVTSKALDDCGGSHLGSRGKAIQHRPFSFDLGSHHPCECYGKIRVCERWFCKHDELSGDDTSPK